MAVNDGASLGVQHAVQRPDIRHVSDPLAAAFAAYEDELLKHARPGDRAEVRELVEQARSASREAAHKAGVVPRGVKR